MKNFDSLVISVNVRCQKNTYGVMTVTDETNDKKLAVVHFRIDYLQSNKVSRVDFPLDGRRIVEELPEMLMSDIADYLEDYNRENNEGSLISFSSRNQIEKLYDHEIYSMLYDILEKYID